ncbi:MAG: VWA domain-containing protein [Bacteroidales bacterium]|jgi:nitric oxide reductase NorD protein|nr:VWA domain-containing protein [Bacteroidales bacterium]MDD3702186.1 VWA domain-containing protein [Bacteroidales bacterium]MDY0368940.1 VWA domain-containing protein [Bacteroidales bacterium]
MSFDEYIYSKFVSYFNSKKKADPLELERRVELDEIKPKLILLARLLTGEAIEVFEAEEEGGYKDQNFFLPAKSSHFADRKTNLLFYVFRVTYLSVQRSLHFNWHPGMSCSLSQSRAQAIETAHLVINAMKEDFPFATSLHQQLYDELERTNPENSTANQYLLYGKWMHDEYRNTTNRSMQIRDSQRPQLPTPETSLKAKAVEQVVHLQADTKQQEDYVMTHNFEKVETAEEYSGVWRDFDGSDELEDHQAALDELQMRFMVRADDPTHSVYQAEFTENTSIAESDELIQSETFYLYDEWDEKRNTYKTEYCKVFSKKPTKADPTYYSNVLTENANTLISLRKVLANVNNKRRQIRYQTQGEDFDIDAVTDMFVDLKTGHTPSEKLYLMARKNEKDLSLLLLLDNSLSTDSYAAGNRVIDVEKQVSILFGEILHEYAIDFSICSFSSHTRNKTNFVTLKAFDESWQNTKYRIGAIEPSGYTRIGASIRHAGSLLDQRPSKNKWVILISDGKPNDYDRYEGRYGIFDVKQALKELHARHIHAFALAIEAQARYYLPQMFGQNHYQILTSPQELLTAIVKLYTKIKQY